MISVEIIISGKVQGVWYRKYTKQKADELQIVGTVRNEDNGNVRVEALGTEEMIEEIVHWCKVGSPKSEVSQVIVNRIDTDLKFDEFKIASQ